MQQIVSANRLTDGLVVYLTADGGWSERLQDGRSATDEASAGQLLATAQMAVDDRVVVDPYLVDIADIDGERRPTKFREYIRALGPTVRLDVGKQAAPPVRHER